MCRYRRGGLSGRGGMGGYQDEYGGDESFDSQEEVGQGWGGRGRPRGGPPRGGKTSGWFFFQPVVDFSATFSGFILQVCTW